MHLTTEYLRPDYVNTTNNSFHSGVHICLLLASKFWPAGQTGSYRGFYFHSLCKDIVLRSFISKVLIIMRLHTFHEATRSNASARVRRASCLPTTPTAGLVPSNRHNASLSLCCVGCWARVEGREGQSETINYTSARVRAEAPRLSVSSESESGHSVILNRHHTTIYQSMRLNALHTSTLASFL